MDPTSKKIGASRNKVGGALGPSMELVVGIDDRAKRQTHEIQFSWVNF